MPDPEDSFGVGEPRYTATEVSGRAGVRHDQAVRLWRALGFPDSAGEAIFTDADVNALGLLTQVVDSGLIDADRSLALTRAVGQTMARLADWEVSALVHQIEETTADDRVLETTIEVARQMAEPFEDLLIYAWRRHVTASFARVVASMSDEVDVHTTELTVGFADIVAFTELSNRLTEEKIGDLVELFESRCGEVVTTFNGRVIKSIGDSVLFVNDDAVRAYDTAEGIINVIGRDPRMPDVRVGLASGSVVTRLGDVFGPPVNLAARLTAVARRNRVIIDSSTAELLPDAEFETRRLPARPVRGFGIVEPVAVRRS